LVHTVYREARHVGMPTDKEARLVVDDPDLTRQMALVRKWRQPLKGTTLFEKVRASSDTLAVRAPYEQTIELTLLDLSALFDRPGWRPGYGGAKWKRITELTLELGKALDADDTARATAVCEAVRSIEHNTGPLVPRSQASWNSEKWPCLCDET
jgi:hypothetical protein